MGNSVSAGIYMGVVFDNEDEEGEAPEFLGDFEGDFDQWVIAQEAPELQVAYDNYDNLTVSEKSDLWADRRAVKEKCPVEMIMFNHYEYPSYALVIRGFEVGSTWGHKVFSTEDLRVDAARFLEATQWCAKHGLAFENPSLFVAGYYG